MNTTTVLEQESLRSAAPPGSPVVFVVDDDVSTREALEMLIRSAGWQPQVFSSAQEFLARPPVAAPSCLVLDVILPDVNGLDVQALVADRIEMPIIFLSGYGDVPMIVRAMRAGAVDFMTKPVADNALVGAIQSAIGISRAALVEAAAIRALRERHASLTPREREVMALVVAGRLNKLVGSDLGISEITVKAHRARMMRKMNARSLPELVRMAERLGLST